MYMLFFYRGYFSQVFYAQQPYFRLSLDKISNLKAKLDKARNPEH
jgi:hypothetical protein